MKNIYGAVAILLFSANILISAPVGVQGYGVYPSTTSDARGVSYALHFDNAYTEGTQRVYYSNEGKGARVYSVGGYAHSIVTGKYGNGVSFPNANNSVLSISSGPETNPIGPSFTFTWWVYIDPAATDAYLVGIRALKAGKIGGQMEYDYDGSGRYAPALVICKNGGGYIIPPMGTHKLDRGKWYFEAVVIDDFSNLKYYNNGVLITSSNTSAACTDPLDIPVLIGNENTTSSNSFWGIIDEVVLYRRSLTSGEIKNLYKEACGYAE